MRTNYKRIKNIISKHFGCDVEKSRTQGIVAVLERNETHVRIILVDGIRSYSDQVGIHLSRLENSGEDLEYCLVDAIQTASKDNFPAVYIHQTPKPDADRRNSKIKSVKQWLSDDKRMELQYSLRKLEVDAMATLETMDENQLSLLLAAIAGMYQSSHTESRNKWAPMYHNLRRALEARGVSSIDAMEIGDGRQTKAVSND